MDLNSPDPKYRSSGGSEIDIVQEGTKRSYRRQTRLEIISYTRETQDCIVHGLWCEGVRKEAMQSDVSVYGEVQM